MTHSEKIDELAPTIPAKGPSWVNYYTIQIISLCNSYSKDVSSIEQLLSLLEDFSLKATSLMIPHTVLIFWVSALNALDALMAKLISEDLNAMSQRLLLVILEFEKNLLDKASSSSVSYSSIDRIIQLCQKSSISPEMTISSSLITAALSVSVAATVHSKKSSSIPGCKDLELILEQIVNVNICDGFVFSSSESLLALTALLQLKGMKYAKKMISTFPSSFELQLASSINERPSLVLLNAILRLRGKLLVTSPVLSSEFIEQLIHDPLYYLPLLESIIQYPIGARKLISNGVIQLSLENIENPHISFSTKIPFLLIMIRLIKKVPDRFFTSFNLISGFFRTSEVLKNIVSTLSLMNASSFTGSTLSFEEFSFLKSILKFILIILQRFPNREGICSFPEGPLPSLLCTIIEHSTTFSSKGKIDEALVEEFLISCSLLSMEMLSTWIHSEPTSLSIFQEYKITDRILIALIDCNRHISAKIIEALPALLTAFSLNENGIKMILNHSEGLEEKLASSLVPPRSIPIVLDPDVFGEALDELARHQPSLKIIIARSLIKALKKLPSLIGVHDRLCPVQNCFYPARTALCQSSFEGFPSVMDSIFGSKVEDDLQSVNIGPNGVEHEHISGGWTEAVESISIVIEMFISTTSHLEIFCQELKGISVLLDSIIFCDSSFKDKHGPDFDFFLGPEAYSFSNLLRHFANASPLLLMEHFYPKLKLMLSDVLFFLGNSSLPFSVNPEKGTICDSNEKFIKLTKLSLALRAFCDLWTSDRENLSQLHPAMVKDTLLFLEKGDFGSNLLHLIVVMIEEHWKYRIISSRPNTLTLSTIRNTNAFLLLTSQLVSMAVVSLSLQSRLLLAEEKTLNSIISQQLSFIQDAIFSLSKSLKDDKISSFGLSLDPLLDSERLVHYPRFDPSIEPFFSEKAQENGTKLQLDIYKFSLILRVARVVMIDDSMNVKIFSNLSSLIPIVISSIRMIMDYFSVNRISSSFSPEDMFPSPFFSEDVAISGAYDNDSTWKGSSPICSLLGRALMDALELVSGMFIVTNSLGDVKEQRSVSSLTENVSSFPESPKDIIPNISQDINSVPLHSSIPFQESCGMEISFSIEKPSTYSEDVDLGPGSNGNQQHSALLVLPNHAGDIELLLKDTLLTFASFRRFPTGTRLLILQILKFTSFGFQKKIAEEFLIPFFTLNIASCTDKDQFAVKAASAIIASTVSSADEYVKMIVTSIYKSLKSFNTNNGHLFPVDYGSCDTTIGINLNGHNEDYLAILDGNALPLVVLGLQILGHHPTTVSMFSIELKSHLIKRIEKTIDHSLNEIIPTFSWMLALLEWIIIDQRLDQFRLFSFGDRTEYQLDTTVLTDHDMLSNEPEPEDDIRPVEDKSVLLVFEKLLMLVDTKLNYISIDLLYGVLRIFNLLLNPVHFSPDVISSLVKNLLIILGEHSITLPLCREVGLSESKEKKPSVLKIKNSQKEQDPTIPGSGIIPLIICIFRGLVEINHPNTIGPLLALQNVHEMAFPEFRPSSLLIRNSSPSSREFKIIPEPGDYVAGLPSAIRDPLSFIRGLNLLSKTESHSLHSLKKDDNQDDNSEPVRDSSDRVIQSQEGDTHLSQRSATWGSNDHSMTNLNNLQEKNVFAINGEELAEAKIVLMPSFTIQNLQIYSNVIGGICHYASLTGEDDAWRLCSLLSLLSELLLSYPHLWAAFANQSQNIIAGFVSHLVSRIIRYSKSIENDLIQQFFSHTPKFHSHLFISKRLKENFKNLQNESQVVQCAWICFFFATVLSSPIIISGNEHKDSNVISSTPDKISLTISSEAKIKNPELSSDPGIILLETFIESLNQFSSQSSNAKIVVLLASILYRSLVLGSRLNMGPFSTNAYTLPQKESHSWMLHRLLLNINHNTSTASIGSRLLETLSCALKNVITNLNSVSKITGCLEFDSQSNGYNIAEEIILKTMAILGRFLNPNSDIDIEDVNVLIKPPVPLIPPPNHKDQKDLSELRRITNLTSKTGSILQSDGSDSIPEQKPVEDGEDTHFETISDHHSPLQQLNEEDWSTAEEDLSDFYSEEEDDSFLDSPPSNSDLSDRGSLDVSDEDHLLEESMLIDEESSSSTEEEEETSYHDPGSLVRSSFPRPIVDSYETSTDEEELGQDDTSEHEDGDGDDNGTEHSLFHDAEHRYPGSMDRRAASLVFESGRSPFEIVFSPAEDILIRSSIGNILFSSFDDEEDPSINHSHHRLWDDQPDGEDAQEMPAAVMQMISMLDQVTGHQSAATQTQPSHQGEYSSTQNQIEGGIQSFNVQLGNSQSDEYQESDLATGGVTTIKAAENTHSGAIGIANPDVVKTLEFLVLTALRETFCNRFQFVSKASSLNYSQTHEHQESSTSGINDEHFHSSLFIAAMKSAMVSVTRRMPSEADPGPISWTMGARPLPILASDLLETLNGNQGGGTLDSGSKAQSKPMETNLAINWSREMRSIAMLRVCSTTARARQLGVLLDAPHDLLQPDPGRLLRRGPFNDEFNMTMARHWPVLLNVSRAIGILFRTVFEKRRQDAVNVHHSLQVMAFPDADEPHNSEIVSPLQVPHVSIVTEQLPSSAGVISEQHVPHDYPSDVSDDSWMSVDGSGQHESGSNSMSESDPESDSVRLTDDVSWPVLYVTPQLDIDVFEALPNDLQREILSSYFYERRQNNPGSIRLQVDPMFLEGIASESIRNLILEMESEERLFYLRRYSQMTDDLYPQANNFTRLEDRPTHGDLMAPSSERNLFFPFHSEDEENGNDIIVDYGPVTGPDQLRINTSDRQRQRNINDQLLQTIPVDRSRQGNVMMMAMDGTNVNLMGQSAPSLQHALGNLFAGIRQIRRRRSTIMPLDVEDDVEVSGDFPPMDSSDFEDDDSIDHDEFPVSRSGPFFFTRRAETRTGRDLFPILPFVLDNGASPSPTGQEKDHDEKKNGLCHSFSMSMIDSILVSWCSRVGSFDRWPLYRIFFGTLLKKNCLPSILVRILARINSISDDLPGSRHDSVPNTAKSQGKVDGCGSYYLSKGELSYGRSTSQNVANATRMPTFARLRQIIELLHWLCTTSLGDFKNAKIETLCKQLSLGDALAKVLFPTNHQQQSIAFSPQQSDEVTLDQHSRVIFPITTNDTSTMPTESKEYLSKMSDGLLTFGKRDDQYDRLVARGLGVLVHLHQSLTAITLKTIVHVALSHSASFRVRKAFFSLLHSLADASSDEMLDGVVRLEIISIIEDALMSIIAILCGGGSGMLFEDSIVTVGGDYKKILRENDEVHLHDATGLEDVIHKRFAPEKIQKCFLTTNNQKDFIGNFTQTINTNSNIIEKCRIQAEVLLNASRAFYHLHAPKYTLEKLFHRPEYNIPWLFLDSYLRTKEIYGDLLGSQVDCDSNEGKGHVQIDQGGMEILYTIDDLDHPLAVLIQAMFMLASYDDRLDVEKNPALVTAIKDVCSIDRQSVTDQEMSNKYCQVLPLPIAIAIKHRRILNVMVRMRPSLMANKNDGPLRLIGIGYPSLARVVLDFENKRSLLARSISMQKAHHTSPIHIRVRRETIFEDSFREIMALPASTFATRPLNITFEGEEGVDAGGLTREWFHLLAQQMLNPGYALFLPAGAGQGGSGDIFYPNRLSVVNPEHLLYFEFVGRVIGKAIRESQLLDCHFAISFYKVILDTSLEIGDLEIVDPGYFRSLAWIKEHGTVENLADLALMMVTEVDDFGRPKILDLIPEGSKIPVMMANLDLYIQKTVEMRLHHSLKVQFEALKRGLFDIISQSLLTIFDEGELELIISGLPLIDDIDDWKRNTEYDGSIERHHQHHHQGYTASSPQVIWFWRAVRSMSYEERAKLLQFVTGTSRVPLGGFSSLLGSNGTIQRFSIHKDTGGSHRLPQAHTCFNQLDIPEYESYEQLRERLLKAIQESNTGFGFA